MVEKLIYFNIGHHHGRKNAVVVSQTEMERYRSVYGINRVGSYDSYTVYRVGSASSDSYIAVENRKNTIPRTARKMLVTWLDMESTDRVVKTKSGWKFADINWMPNEYDVHTSVLRNGETCRLVVIE